MGTIDGWFLIEPLDTIWLRSGKPFLAGEDSSDSGQFPPSPWSLQGAVRSRLLRAARPQAPEPMARDEVQTLVGDAGALPGGWTLKGPFPACTTEQGLEPWFRCPPWIALDGGVAIRARPMSAAAMDDLDSPGWTGGPWPQLRCSEKDKPTWISASNLRWALTGEGRWDPKGHGGAELPSFVAVETRPGIELDSAKGVVKDGMLYVAEHFRFAPGTGLMASLSAQTHPDIPVDALRTGMGSLGRKSRLISFSPAPVHPAWSGLLGELPGDLSVGPPKRLGAWVVLLTDALLQTGEKDGAALPPFVVPSGAKIVLSLGRPGTPVGGVDRYARRDKGGEQTTTPVRATWAAGSSWLLSLEGLSAAEAQTAAQSLMGLPPHRATDAERFGFGQRLAAFVDLDTWTPLGAAGDHNA